MSGAATTTASSPTKRDTVVEHYPGESDQHIDTGHLQRVVCISIDSNSAKYVIDWALENFIRPETDLIVLVNVRLLDVPMAPYVDAAGYMDDVAEERRKESHDLLKMYASQLWQKQIVCKAISMIGDPKAEIIRKTAEVHANALIMGSRNLGTIKRTLLGSVSDHCVHNAPCTVIIAKAPFDEEENKSAKRRSFLSRSRAAS